MERIPCFICMMIGVLLLRCLILISLFTAANTSTINTDQDALLALKAHITHDPTSFLANNWNISRSVCNWMGVTCDVHSHRVIALNISLFGLIGTIPSQLGNLSSLQSLDLSYNRLWGAIPSSIFSINSLQILYLDSNQLSGSFPSSIFNMSSLLVIDFTNNTLSDQLPPNIYDHFPNLESMFLENNMFHGEIPPTLSNCRHLRKLSLSYNNFSGAIPKQIGNLIKLQELYLSSDKLEGEIPQELGNLAELEILKLSDNLLSGTIPSSIFKLSSLLKLYLPRNNLTGEIPHEISNLHNIEWLVLSHNKLVGTFPTTILNMSTLRFLWVQNNSLSGSLPSSTDFRLPNLEEFHLWKNNFRGTIPRFIFNASKLSRLDLSTNSFTGFIPDTFGNLRNLKRLSLHDNFLTSSTPKLSFLSSFSNCKYLESFILSRNPLNGILPRSLGNLSHYLEIFSMSDCNISGGIPEEINNLTNLIGIELKVNKLNGSIPVTLGKLQKLQFLSFLDNKLEGSIPNSLCRLIVMEEMDLSENKLSGPIPACFGNLTTLRRLYLSSNEFTSIPSTLWNLKDILYLNLSSNMFTGPLPFQIENLKVLIGIDLSRNNLSGDIPTTIQELKNLQALYLGYNRLQGPIPSSFGDLVSLEALDLSYNNLSGIIPPSLEKLLYLEDLNLSFNRLEGEIPRGGSFAKLSSKSFMGNVLLCGSPNLQVPPCKSSKTGTNGKSMKNDLLLRIVLPLNIALILVVILALRFGLISRCQKRVTKLPNDINVSPLATRRRFSHLELLRATDGFSENNLIGKGSFGSVYKARIQDGMEVAVKVFHLQFERAWKSFEAECEVMRNIRHRNLVKIISSCSNEDFRALILEYKTNGSLEKGLYSSNCILDIFRRLNIMIDVALALEYLHFGYSTPIIHCDLKPSNVLLDNDMVAHLSDFGITKLVTEEDQTMTHTETLATIGYMAPEYGREGRVSINGDVYSFGIMLIETFTRKKPTDEIFIGEMTLKRWVNDLLPISVMEVVDANLLSREDSQFAAKEKCVSFILNLAMECTVESPKQRINAKEIVRGLLKIRNSLLKNVGGRKHKRQ